MKRRGPGARRGSPPVCAAGGPVVLERRRIDLTLRHAWTIARGSSTRKTNVLVRLSHGGLVGYGEAAPSARYGEDWQTAGAAIDRMAERLHEDPARWEADLDLLEADFPGDRAARAAIDIALHDLMSRREGIPLYARLGAATEKAPVTSFSIGIDDIAVMQSKVREASDFGILKIKVGAQGARAILEGIRAVTDKPLYVDANESFSERREAVDLARWMASIGVVLLEQPFPAADLDASRDLRDRVDLPIIADESVLTGEDLSRAAQAFDGVNVKLQKSGGLRPARRLIAQARSLGMAVMIGCMIETSIGITAAAHMSPFADHADLDGNLLIDNDPFRGVTIAGGRLVLPEGPGLGVTGAW
jgi:L-alanine-DL-glutamate epimerase-like enolase superfamily enzyme